MKKTKRFTSALIALLMVLTSLFSVPFGNITAMAATNNSGYVKTFKLNAKEITLTIPADQSAAKKTVKATVKVKGKKTSKKLKVKSTNPSVATVKYNAKKNKFTVTAVSEGTAVIKATTKAKNKKGKKITRKVKVTVVKEGAPAPAPAAAETPAAPAAPAETPAPAPTTPEQPAKKTYTVDFNTMGICEVESQTIEEGKTVIKPADPSSSLGDFEGWFLDSSFKTPYLFTSSVVADIVLYAKFNFKDSDNDGFNDYEEIFLMGTNPNEYNNPETDTDEDGLTDDEEVHIYNTDINSSDTDNDGLTDYEEVKTYNTNPNNEDTDGDGLSDGFEVKYGLNPLLTHSDGIHKDNEREIEQVLDDSGISEKLKEDNAAVPSLSGAVSGDLTESVFVSTSGDSTLEDNRAIVGKPIYVDGDDSSVSGLTLSFDVSYHTGKKEELCIVELGEDGTFDIKETEVSADGNTLSCVLDKSGDYSVLDTGKFLSDLGIDIDEEIKVSKPKTKSLKAGLRATKIKGQADVVFAIDTTGSMSGTINEVINNVSSFSSTLANEYNVAVNFALVDFKDLEEDGPGTTKVVTDGYQNWYSDVDSFISKVETLYADGGGDTPECDIDALETSRLLDFRRTSNKFIILITDTYYKVANDYGISSMDEEIERLKNDGIIVSVVAPTEEESTYKNLFEKTGGIFANIYSDFADALLNLASLVGEETSDGTWVILKHGYRYVRLPELPSSTSTSDTDGDGLTDYNELGRATNLDLKPFIENILKTKGIPPEEYYGKTSITVYDAISDPSLADTDGDGIGDKSDTAPWAKGLAGGIVGALKLCSHAENNNISGNGLGHAYVAYTSFVNDTLNLYGILVTSSSNIASNYQDVEYKDISNPPKFGYHNVNVTLNSVTTLGGWAGWLANELRGTWINQEKQLYPSEVPDTQYSITSYLTYSDVEKFTHLSKDHSSWWELYNCSSFAVDFWNGVTDDNISAGFINTPYNLIQNMKKRPNCEHKKPLRSNWPS